MSGICFKYSLLNMAVLAVINLLPMTAARADNYIGKTFYCGFEWYEVEKAVGWPSRGEKMRLTSSLVNLNFKSKRVVGVWQRSNGLLLSSRDLINSEYGYSLNRHGWDLISIDVQQGVEFTFNPSNRELVSLYPPQITKCYTSARPINALMDAQKKARAAEKNRREMEKWKNIPPPDLTKTTDEDVCRIALSGNSWATEINYVHEVYEAKARGFTPARCRAVIDQPSGKLITQKSAQKTQTETTPAAPRVDQRENDGATSITQRLQALKKLEDAGLISKEEAAAKRKEILKNL